MNARNIFDTIGMMVLPHGDRTLVLDDEIMLSDMDDYNDSKVDIDMVREWQQKRPFKISFAMALLCECGMMHIRINLAEYFLGKGSLMIAIPGSIYEFIDMSSDCRLTIIVLAQPVTVEDINSQAAVIARRYLSKHPIISLSSKDSAEFRSIYESMRQKIAQPDYNYKKEVVHFYLQVLYCNICHLMKSYIEVEDERLRNRKTQIYDTFIQELQQNYTTRRDITFYANRLCLTPKYLSQVVLAVSGRYAKDWIRDYVILEAKALLKSGQYTTQQVSDKLNFPNQSFFGTYFKKAVGCSPKTYQENV